MSDLISRQAAIDALKKCYCGGEDSCGEPWIYEEHALNFIKQLPSALGTNLAEVGTDAISRQEAIDAISEYGNGSILWMNVSELARRIEQLPAIQPEPLQPWEVLAAQAVLPQPKRGKWEWIEEHGRYECSECGEQADDLIMGYPRWNFCPNCGADMREVTT